MKKFLSLVLSFCLIASLIPAAFATGEAATGNDGMHFVFKAASYGKAAKDAVTGDSIDLDTAWLVANDNAAEPVFANTGTDPWRLTGRRYVETVWISDDDGVSADTGFKADALGMYIYGTRVWTASFAPSQNTGFAILLKAEKTGKFIPQLTFEAKYALSKFEVFLVPKSKMAHADHEDRVTMDTSKSLNGSLLNHVIPQSTAYKIGEVDMHTGEEVGDQETVTVSFGEYEIEAAEDYYLMFRGNGINEELAEGPYKSAGIPNMYLNLYSFDLVPQKIDEVSATASSDTVYVGGDGVLVTVAAKDQTGNSLKDVTVTYESLTPEYAKVGKTGVVTGIASGTATIRATVKDSLGNSKTADVTIEVKEKDSTMPISFKFGAAGYDEDSEIDYAGVVAYDDMENVDASVNANTYQFKEPVWAITNTDPWRVDGQVYMNDGGNALYITDADGVEEKPSFQPNAISAYSYGTRAWQNGVPKQNAAVAIRINIKRPGTFTPALSYYGTEEMPKWDVFLVPASDTYIRDNPHRIGFDTKYSGSLTGTVITNVINNRPEYKLGVLDMSTSTPGRKTASFGNYTIPDGAEGEYVLLMRTNGVSDELAEEYSEQSIPGFYTSLYSFDLTPVSAQDLAEDAFAPTEDETYVPAPSTSVVTFTVCGDGEETEVDTESATAGEAIEVSAPEEKDGYKFLYWVRGNSAAKQIVSHSASFDYVPFEGANYLLAVYGSAEDADTVEFYNANGQPLKNFALEDGNLPDYPSMAGYGKATGWAMRTANGGSVAYKAGDAAPESGERIFVATYDEPEETIIINGENYAYGDTVTCTSNDANFSYWMKKVNGKNEIVSASKTYTFNAWESCTVTEVCKGAVDLGEAVARKILLGTMEVGDQTAVMAEFIGFSDATEKGIIVNGTQYIPMQTGKNMFTVIGDLAGDYVGYAVVDGKKYVSEAVNID